MLKEVRLAYAKKTGHAHCFSARCHKLGRLSANAAPYTHADTDAYAY